MPNDSPRRPSRRITDPAQAAEIDEILSQESTTVSMMHPLDIFVDRDWLLQEVEHNLRSLRARSAEEVQAAERPHDTEQHIFALIRQRLEFIAWLRGQPERVWLSMYPADDALGDDLPDDMPIEPGDTELPF